MKFSGLSHWCHWAAALPFVCCCAILNIQFAYADVGSTPGTFRVSQTGAATYTIPIWSPPGPRGVQPNIALVYNSQSGNGSVGVGWNIAGISSITRCNRTFAQDGVPAAVTLATSDGYCLDGQRLILSFGTYGTAGSDYVTEVDSKRTVTANGAAGNGPASFTVQTRDGHTLKYGSNATANSQVLASGTDTAVTWMLDEVSDAAGNTMTITYCPTGTPQESNCPTTALQGSTLPSTISWTPQSHGATTYAYTMTFKWGVNVAPWAGYVAGTPLVNPGLLGSIVIAYNGAQIKEYALGYQQQSPTTGSGRDVLTQVQECASSSTDCLTPTTIAYQSGSAGLSASATTVVSSGLKPCVTWYGSIAKYDFNGDGYTDLLYAVNGTCYVAFGSATGYGAPVSTGISSSTNGATLAGDLVGTGKDGLLARNGSEWYYYTWNGSAFVGTSTGLAFDTTAFQFALADINGDGLPDLVSLYAVNTTDLNLSVDTRLNTSTGGTPSFKASAVAAYGVSSGGVNSAQLVTADTQGSKLRSFDFNGDGSQDLGLYYSECVTVISPEGVPVTACESFFDELIAQPGGTFAAFTISEGGGLSNPGQVAFANVNNDACTDAIVIPSNQIYYSSCTGTAATVVTSPAQIVAVMDLNGDGLADVVTTSLSGGISYNSNCNYIVFDANGDGLDDLACAIDQGGLTYYVHNDLAQPPDLLTSITDGYGNYAKPSYVSLIRATGAQYSVTSAAPAGYKNYNVPLYLVSEINFNDPSGSTSGYSETDRYSNAVTSLQGRGFAGMEVHYQLDSRNGVYTVTDVGLQFPMTGILNFIDKVTNLTSSSSTLSDYVWTSGSTTKFNNINGAYEVVTQSISLKQFELASSGNRLVTTTTTTFNNYDGFGNPGTVTKTVNDNDSGSPYSGDSWTTETTFTWDESQSCALPSKTTVAYTASIGSAVTITKTFTPNLTACNYSQIVTQPGTNVALTENLGYDSFGNVDSDSLVGSGQTRTTTANWGTTGQFPMLVTDPSGATTSINYNFSYGLPSMAKDPNNLTTSMQYDAFGRKSKQTNPDGTSMSWTYATCPTGLPATCGVSIDAITNDVNGNYIRDVQSYSDAVGRTFATFSRNENSGSGGHTYTASGMQYDSLGRVAARDIPVPAFNGAVAPQITYHYDLLNRVMQEQRPISASNSTLQTTQYTYSGRTTTITDANGHKRTLIHDVNGWLRQTKDATGYAIILGYDAAGAKTSTTDSANNQLWSAQYQYGIGPFVVQATDTDLGTWSYSYNAFGDQTGWTDPKNQSVTIAYDALSRPVTRKEFDLFTQWTWGTSAAAHEIGQLHSVCTGITAAKPTQCDANSYAESEVYDGAGRLAGRAIVIPGDGTYSYSWAYNPTTGLLDTMTYPADPSGFQLKLQYGYTNGLRSSIKDVNDNVTLWSLGNPSSQVAVDGHGHYLQENLGNGLVVNSNFDAVTGWLNGMTAGPTGGSALQSASYLFDKVGNLTQRQDNVAGMTESIFPDALNRVDHTVGTGGATSIALSYDSIGRLASWAVPNGAAANVNDYTTPQSGCTYYANAQLHAVRNSSKGSNTSSFCYDANGNVLSEVGISITWTSYNQPSLISVPIQGNAGFGGQRSYSYDNNHQRWQEEVIDSTGTTITDYIGGLFEKVMPFSKTTTYRNYIPAGNNLVVYNHSSAGNTISYITRDTLGSTSLVTNQAGAAVVQANFADFGWNLGTLAQQTTLAGVTELGFTGQEQMYDVGMVNMNGRVYEFSGSYFLSPDPVIPKPDDTRSYNRYAYARYNPLTYVDPSGFADGDCYANDDNILIDQTNGRGPPLADCVENIPVTCTCFTCPDIPNCPNPFDPNKFQCLPGDPSCYSQLQQPCSVPFSCPQQEPGGSGGSQGGPPQGNQQQQQQQQCKNLLQSLDPPTSFAPELDAGWAEATGTTAAGLTLIASRGALGTAARASGLTASEASTTITRSINGAGALGVAISTAQAVDAFSQGDNPSGALATLDTSMGVAAFFPGPDVMAAAYAITRIVGDVALNIYKSSQPDIFELAAIQQTTITQTLKKAGCL